VRRRLPRRDTFFYLGSVKDNIVEEGLWAPDVVLLSGIRPRHFNKDSNFVSWSFSTILRDFSVCWKSDVRVKESVHATPNLKCFKYWLWVAA
jgi:hypothetical protein